MRNNMKSTELRCFHWLRFGRVLMAAALGLSVGSALRGEETKQPVFVGAKQCAKCHDGPGFGYQQCLMLLTAHSQAYAALAKPESQEIARLSGIPEEPQKAANCLGCHATGAEAEQWEKDETFHLEDGVQCEKCHGPGSEYMDEAVMKDPQAAMVAGLMMPKKEDCMNCHKVKGSHVAVLQSRKFDIDEAWQQMRHPTPEEWKNADPPPLPQPVADGAHKYVGSLTCGSMSQEPGDGLPVQQVATEQSCSCLCRARYRAGSRHGSPGWCRGRSHGRASLPQVPRDGLR